MTRRLVLIVAAVFGLLATSCSSTNRQAPDLQTVTLSALEDFQTLEVEGFVPYYRDERSRALAVNAAQYPDRFAAAQASFPGESAEYDIVIETVLENDGESTYVLRVNGEKAGEFQNPEQTEGVSRVTHTWEGVAVPAGATIQVESNAHSNGKIPEGDGFAYSRGRWSSLTLTPAME